MRGETAASETALREGGSGKAMTFAVVGLALVPLAYVLSIGPAVWLCHPSASHGHAIAHACHQATPALEAFYQPLRGLRDTPLMPALEGWVDLFH